MDENVESGLEGGEGTDESQVSTVSPDEATSSISPDLSDAQIEAVIANPKFERMVQKHSNKAYSNLEKRVDDLSLLDRYKALTDAEGLPHEAAKQRLKFEDDVAWARRQRGEDVGGEPAEAPVPERASSINYIDAYKKVGVEPPNTMEDLLWAERFQSQDDLENALLKKKLAQPTAPASAGTVIQPAGGKTPPPPKVEDLLDELEELQRTDSDIARQEEIERILKEEGEWE
jgi:hypothetical protein